MPATRNKPEKLCKGRFPRSRTISRGLLASPTSCSGEHEGGDRFSLWSWRRFRIWRRSGGRRRAARRTGCAWTPSRTTCPGERPAASRCGKEWSPSIPLLIPLGTRLFVPGYGKAVAADVGVAIKGRIIDLWMPTDAQARKWGRKTVVITVLPLRPSRSARRRPVQASQCSRAWCLAAVVAVGACSLTATAAAPINAAAPGLAAALERALAAADVPAARTAALAVDLRTGQVVFRANAGLASRPHRRRSSPCPSPRFGSSARDIASARTFSVKESSPAGSGAAISFSSVTATRRSPPPTSTRSPATSRPGESAGLRGRVVGDEGHFDSAARRPAGSPGSSESSRRPSRRSPSRRRAARGQRVRGGRSPSVHRGSGAPRRRGCRKGASRSSAGRRRSRSRSTSRSRSRRSCAE